MIDDKTIALKVLERQLDNETLKATTTVDEFKTELEEKDSIEQAFTYSFDRHFTSETSLQDALKDFMDEFNHIKKEWWF